MSEWKSMSVSPAVPLTLEGSSVLHQMMRFRWAAWKTLAPAQQDEILGAAADLFGGMEQSAIFSLIGHKGDLMLVHFRRNFEELNQAEMAIARLRLADFLEPTSSY